MFVPLSVGMFPHLFQHWMTAKDVKTFRLGGDPAPDLHHARLGALHPAGHLGLHGRHARRQAGHYLPDLDEPNEVLGMLVKKLTNPVVAGFLGVGIVSATMSLDSQFLALSSMFTHDILAADLRRETDRRQAADLAGPLDGRGHRGRGLRALAVCAAARSIRWVSGVSRIRRPVPAGLRRALLEAGDKQRGDRFDSSLLRRRGSTCSAESNWGETRNSSSWA